MYIDLQARRELEFERFVAEVYSSRPDSLDMIIVDTPWGHETVFRAGVPYLIRKIHAALDTQTRFAEEEQEEWGPLPMGAEACALLKKARGALYLLACYSFSLQLNDFAYRKHPRIFEFACGAMDLENAPEHVTSDPELKFKFPAQPLPGLSERLIWFSPSECLRI